VLLEFFRPEQVVITREKLASELQEIEHGLSRCDQLLRGASNAGHVPALQRQRSGLARRAATLRSQLETLSTARFEADPDAMWRHTLRVA
jgi:hypothetical protein